jgi:hypothetical protein
MKRIQLPVLAVYLFVIFSFALAAAQLFEGRAAAEEKATCCIYSITCPGEQTCWFPRTGQTACCGEETTPPPCDGPNYCGMTGPPGAN